jgi:hypothetical protein
METHSLLLGSQFALHRSELSKQHVHLIGSHKTFSQRQDGNGVPKGWQKSNKDLNSSRKRNWYVCL